MSGRPPDPAVGPRQTAAIPRAGLGIAPVRRTYGLTAALIGLPILTACLVVVRGSIKLDSVLLVYLLAVVVVAVVGGMLPALTAAVVSFLLANWFLTEPYYTFDVESRDSVIALAVFLLVAATVSVLVDVSSRRLVSATRSRMEADMLSWLAAQPVADTSVTGVLELIRASFGMDAVALVDRRGGWRRVLDTVGGFDAGAPPALRVDAGGGLEVVAEGPELFAEDRRMLAGLASAAGRAWEGRELAAEAARSAELSEIDRVRSALLAAVGHDLRTPLSGVKAAVTSLRQTDIAWTVDEQDELLRTIEESADRLDDLIANLLAMSRLQAGALSVHLAPTALDEVVGRALIGMPAGRVDVQVAEDLPMVLADPGLLERVIANVADNALRHEPAGGTVLIGATAAGTADVALSVVDHGPGLPEQRWSQMFAPFQRFDDRGAGGVGLGLAIARGFSEAMDAPLEPSHTDGGGLTMTITLPIAR